MIFKPNLFYNSTIVKFTFYNLGDDKNVVGIKFYLFLLVHFMTNNNQKFGLWENFELHIIGNDAFNCNDNFMKNLYNILKYAAMIIHRKFVKLCAARERGK